MNNNTNKIKEQRKTLAYSTRELANLTNVLEGDIIAYEANKKVATLKTIEKIANATNTKVSDWVDEEYFIKPKYRKSIETMNDEIVKEKITDFFGAMFQADNVMEILCSALIDMEEIKITKDKEIIFSEFAKKIIISVSSVKLKKVFKVCKDNKHIEQDANNIMVKKSDSSIDKKKISIEKITFDSLLQELRIIFKGTDSIDVIIQALVNIDFIDSRGCCSEKAKLLVDTIISNKIKKCNVNTNSFIAQ